MKADQVTFNMWWEIFEYEIRCLFTVEALNKMFATTLRKQPDCFRHFLIEKFLLKDAL